MNSKQIDNRQKAVDKNTMRTQSKENKIDRQGHKVNSLDKVDSLDKSRQTRKERILDNRQKKDLQESRSRSRLGKQIERRIN